MKQLLRPLSFLRSRCAQLKSNVVKAEVPFKVSRHRHILGIYDLNPEIGAFCYVAPNATIVGEVQFAQNCVVWYGAVIRGDMNAVNILNYVIVGERVVIHTSASLPNGMPASVNIGNYVVIQDDSILYSCTIGEKCLIGYKSIVLEGAKLEDGCALAPGTVVPPGRIIPSNQLWAGNPAQYVRDIQESDYAQYEYMAQSQNTISAFHKYEFLPQNSAYLQKENTTDDVNPDYVAAALQHENYENQDVKL